MPKIKAIYVVSMVDEDGYTFGYEVGCAGIKEIKDTTIEYEDSIHFEYQVIKESGQLKARVQNVPVVVEYFEDK